MLTVDSKGDGGEWGGQYYPPGMVLSFAYSISLYITATQRAAVRWQLALTQQNGQ